MKIANTKLLILLLLVAVSVQAQTMADAARKERERRAEIRNAQAAGGKAAKTVTDTPAAAPAAPAQDAPKPAVAPAPPPRPLPPLQADLAAKAAIAAERFGEARNLYVRLSENQPDNMDYVIWIGRISGWLKEYDTAMAAFNRALDRNSENSEALIGKAYILMYQQEYGAAEELLEKAAGIVAPNPDLLMAFARNYHYSRQDERALEELARVLALEPDHAEARELKSEITPRRFEMTMAYGQDRFSFASPAHVYAVSIGYAGAGNRVVLHHEVWDKFGEVAHRSGFNISHRFEQSLWIRGGMMLAPGAGIVARQDYTGGFAYLFPKGIVVSTDYRHMRFSNALVHVASPSIEYYFEKPVWLQAAFYQAWTRYAAPGLPVAGSRAFSVRYNHQLNRAMLFHAGYARGNESFSALSVDRLGKFEAKTVTGGIDFRTSSSFVTGVFYSYQFRSTGSHQKSAGISLTLRK
jgi:YaiO family outer membrane protein